MARRLVSSATSGSIEDFLTIPGSNRAARLIGPPRLPRPLGAAVDRQGNLSWTWYGYDHGSDQQPPPIQEPPATLCFGFARLADATDKQIRRFAGKWGPLGLALDGPTENTKDWRRDAQLARSLLRFVTQRMAERRGEEKDWVTICKSLPLGETSRAGLSADMQMAIVASAVNTCFARARGHRILDMVHHQLQIHPSASNLFGVLIVQIAHVIARSDQFAVCAGCQNPFPPERPLSRGVRQYCKRCRKAKVPQRDASRDWRQRAALKQSRDRRKGHQVPANSNVEAGDQRPE
jgi:hypothetical protein